MGGFSIGIISLVVPVYLAEFAPPNIRGRLVGFFDIFIQIGTLGGFWMLVFFVFFEALLLPHTI